MKPQDQARFLSKIHKDNSGCLIWLAAKNSSGIPVFRLENKSVSAKKLWFIFNNPSFKSPTKGFQLNPSCKKKDCVNPAHQQVIEYNKALLTKDLIKRIKEKTDENRNSDGCWQWKGSKHNGYPILVLNGKTIFGIHRKMFSLYFGEFSTKQREIIKTTCENKLCINPNHMIMVSNARCKHGHVKEGITNRKGIEMQYCKVCAKNRLLTKQKNNTE